MVDLIFLSIQVSLHREPPEVWLVDELSEVCIGEWSRVPTLIESSLKYSGGQKF